MMTGRRLQALGLVLVLLMSATAAPASAQADDPKQPSVDNPHMHFWGTSQLDQCWTHFDRNGSDGSSVDGYGMKTFSQGTQVEVDISCRIQSGENFKQDMWLSENGSINIELWFRIFSGDCTDNSECKDLTITLSRGNTEIAQSVTSQETVNNYEDFSIKWNIPVNETMYRWNKSGEEPVVRIEYSAPGVSGFLCGWVQDCTGEFRMYYSNNEDNYSVEANFPVVNATGDGPMNGDDDDGILGGAVGDSLPGFGLAAGLGALAMAAIASSRREE